MRIKYPSVTVFLKYNDKYLCIARNSNKSDLPDLLTAVGGKCEPNENYIQTVIREVKEETNLEINPVNIKFKGIEFWNMISDTSEKKDYIVGFFVVTLQNINNVLTQNDEGLLTWLTKEELKSKKYSLVDDLNYLLDDITSDDSEIFFAHSLIDENYKIVKFNKNYSLNKFIAL